MNHVYLPDSKVNNIIKHKLSHKLPEKMLEKFKKSLESESLLFINEKRSHVKSNKLEYYKLLHHIYTTIISK